MSNINVIKRDGTSVPVCMESIRRQTMAACEGIEGVQYELIEQKAKVVFFDGIKTEDIQLALIKTAEQLVDVDRPNYAYVAGRLILFDLYRQIEYIYGDKRKKGDPNIYDRITLKRYFERFGDEFLGDFYKAYSDEEIDILNTHIKPENDFLFTNTAIRVAKTQYLARTMSMTVKPGEEFRTIVELPQHMLMCVCMHTMQKEDKKIRLEKIIEAYDVFSNQYAVPATPHLSYSRIKNGASASCLVTSVKDNIESIFGTLMPSLAYGSKLGAGIGADISRIRALGSSIGFVANASKGKIPLCALIDRLALYIDQGGKRKGAIAVTCRSFDIDIFEFLNLRKQQGEERKRAHNLSLAIAADDIFMSKWDEYNKVMDKYNKARAEDPNSDLSEYVEEANSITYTLFDPKDVPDLFETYGEEGNRRYLDYCEEFRKNPSKFNHNTQEIPVSTVVKAILTSIARTNYPYLTYYDNVNNNHKYPELGVIRCGNLCQEVMMPADDGEIAVCNLASINLARVGDDMELLRRVCRALTWFLDNSIDTTRYPHPNAEKTQKKYRSIGIGCMGEAEYIACRQIHFGSQEHLDVINKIYPIIQEAVDKESKEILKLKGPCGGLPNVRNAYQLCIAPNTTSGVFGSTTSGIEPTYGKVFIDSRSGNYSMRITSPHLSLDNWNYYKTGFEIDQYKMIDMTAARQKYIDMSISHSFFLDMNKTDLFEVSKLYVYAWSAGLKSVYYLRGKKNEDTVEECTSCAN